MTKQTNLIDFSAVLILCVLGFGSILLVWLAGIPASSGLAGLWRHFGIVNLIGTSFLCLLIAAVILGRTFTRGAAHQELLLIVLLVASVPTALFSVVLVGKAIHYFYG